MSLKKLSLQRLFTPIEQNIRFWGIVSIFLFLNGLGHAYIRAISFKRFFFWSIINLTESIVLASILCVLLYGIRRYSAKSEKLIRNCILATLGFFLLIETYLIIFFQTTISQTIITLILQTTKEEAIGFLHTFIFDTRFIYFLIASFLIAMISIIFSELSIFLSKKYNYFMGGVILAFVTFCLVLSFKPFQTQISIKGAISGVGRLIQSYLNYKHTLGQEESISYETNITDCQNILSPTIVVVIGESFSKHHSSLYNYPKETNPKLEEVRLSSNLYVFDDVICPYNITNKMLKAILSMHSVDSQEEWNNFPIWPHIFRDAGYFVSFISNQITKFNDDGNAGDGLGSYFFQHPDVVSHSFDYRNTYKYKYDLEFLSEIDKYTIPSDKNELQIIQLHGQHVRARYRFPLEYEYFKVSDYTHSNYFQTTDSQKQEIADYDNATRYNDYVLSKIIERYQDKEAIIFYFSDHGEEVYDYREVIGRSQSETKTANEMKYQYEIPFMIYVSQKYKERNKEIVCQIEQAIHKPFMSDDIGHILLGVSGIKCQWYNPQRDLLSPLYNEKRIRMIEGSQVYRKHME